jgi:lipopolysaccharide/colanic/teichoic acid biosynthesis glycosyltransferase
MLQVSHPQHESFVRSVHFFVSRIAAAALLALTSPLFLAVAVAIKLGSPDRVFYRQKRVGYKGQEFDMLKFRSMVPDAETRLGELLERNEHDGALFKIKDDPRVTRVGRFLRKYSLDELPQLINVVRGDMSLVGPRPCLAREMTMFGEAEHRRFMVRPGMTGLWQVSGRSDLLNKLSVGRRALSYGFSGGRRVSADRR